MIEKQFTGLWTALVTPFKEGNGIDNEVDFEALEKLLQMQIDGKVDGVLLLGTTGERPTLSEKEELEIIKFSVNILKGKTKIMLNAGSNSTQNSLKTIKNYDKIEGIDCYLLVNPYYNKPTQTGLFLHFTTCADATQKPVILYNIKGRTSVNLETSTLIKIIDKSKNVVGVKEASGDLEQMKDVIKNTSDDFCVLSGDDGLTYDLIKKGGDGVISVASNIIPGKMKEFVDLCLEKSSKAKDLNKSYSDFFSKIFIQTNPLPTKTFLAHKGIIKEEFRLPLCKMDKKERKEFIEFIDKKGF